MSFEDVEAKLAELSRHHEEVVRDAVARSVARLEDTTVDELVAPLRRESK